MNPTLVAARAGLSRGWIGVITMGDLLVTEREDGTLLRAKAIPNGMLGYLLGKVVNISGQIAFVVAATLLTGAFLFTGLAIGSPGSWLTLAWVLVLGLLATLPLGAVLGSLFPSQRSAGGPMVLLLAGLAAISGIFYPITHLPVFLQWTGQVFPMYWLGLGMRSALLPNAMAAVEIGHSWRHLATFGVLSAWAIAGLVLAPVVLRRMARRANYGHRSTMWCMRWHGSRTKPRARADCWPGAAIRDISIELQTTGPTPTWRIWRPRRRRRLPWRETICTLPPATPANPAPGRRPPWCGGG